MRKLAKVLTGIALGTLFAAASLASANATEEVPAPPGMETPASSAEVRAELELLAETQSQSEAETLWNSGEKVAGLHDLNGDLVAVMLLPEGVSPPPMIVPFTSQFPCTGGSELAVLYGDVTRCYTGTGWLATSVTGVREAWSGTRKTTLTRTGGTTVIPASSWAIFSGAGTKVSAISRS